MRYLSDVLMWGWCWLAWVLVVKLPDRATNWARNWLLPFAGFYGYHAPDLHSWRWSERVRR